MVLDRSLVFRSGLCPKTSVTGYEGCRPRSSSKPETHVTMEEDRKGTSNKDFVRYEWDWTGRGDGV